MGGSFLPIIRSVKSMRAHVAAWRERGQTIALVPTMGSLHEGHVGLIRLAKVQADRVVTSVFVNPRQFGAGEDFDRYPRSEAGDAQSLAQSGSDVMYAPSLDEMYPTGFSTTVSVSGVTEGLCGELRPGHFDGVATVVAKLLIQTAPDVAIFGEKDYQQLLLIRRLARDLDLTVQVLGAPIARDADGLALSSRNSYLSPAERATAPRLHLVLQDMASALVSGAPVLRVEAGGREALIRCGFDKVDYFEVRMAADLAPAPKGPLAGAARLLAAAWLGKTRLIDNLAVGD